MQGSTFAHYGYGTEISVGMELNFWEKIFVVTVVDLDGLALSLPRCCCLLLLTFSFTLPAHQPGSLRLGINFFCIQFRAEV